MLGREQCVALAVAFAEVREHRMAYGDFYFDGPARRVWINAITVFPSPEEMASGRVSVIPGQHLWCPRTDQLLDLAVHEYQKIDYGPGGYFVQGLRLMQHALEPAWRFGPWGIDGSGESAEEDGWANSVDGAIHRWLMKIAEMPVP